MNREWLDRYLDEMPQRGIPQCSLFVTLDGKTVYEKTVGRETQERNIGFVCSISKITTCVAAMRLVEEGKIGLDDPVATYLPAYKNLTVKQKDGSVTPAQNVMTIRQLFTMTGGLNYNLKAEPILQAIADRSAGTVEVVNSFAKSPLDFEPGTKFQYSLCHDVLAAVVEVVSGERFADYVKKIILDPLGMKDTGYHLPETLRPRLAKQYSYRHGVSRAVEREPACPYVLTDNYDSGGAGLYTTAEDQIKLMTTLACGGTTKDGYRLLKTETIAQMEVGLLSDEILKKFMPGRLYGYSWGLCGRVHVDPVASSSPSSVGEFGWDGATGSFALIDRKNRLAIYFGAHLYDCDYMTHKGQDLVRDLVYRAVLPEEAAKILP